MRAVPLIALSLAALSAVSARAAEAPAFLSGDAQYASDADACKALDEGEGIGLQLTAKGLFGYEFGCTFSGFSEVKFDESSDTVDQYIATAACGDDSGISRPDLILMIPSDEETVIVTSQNDYVLQSLWEKDGEDGGGFTVQKEFIKCPM